jgi:hypothetical protein
VPTLLESILSEKTERRGFPHLAYLLAGWFHQDFELEGDGLEAIVRRYAADVSEEERRGTVEDIGRFVARFGASEKMLNEAVERVFHPEVLIDGWDGLTTRQWLERVAKLLAS